MTTAKHIAHRQLKKNVRTVYMVSMKNTSLRYQLVFWHNWHKFCKRIFLYVMIWLPFMEFHVLTPCMNFPFSCLEAATPQSHLCGGVIGPEATLIQSDPPADSHSSNRSKLLNLRRWKKSEKEASSPTDWRDVWV